jgi:hypothetical protein
MLPWDRIRASAHHGDILTPLLPSSYASELDEEAREALRLGIEGLREAAAAGDLQRGASFHTAALRRYLGLKHALDDDKRTELARLLYHLVTSDVPASMSVRRRWCGLLCKLLKRMKHERLELPWRPLLPLLLQHGTSKLRVAAYASRSQASGHLAQLAKCAAQCRRHFPEGSAAEILEAVEPLLCPKDPQFFTGATLLSLLLPTHGKEGLVWQPRILSLWRSSGIEG